MQSVKWKYTLKFLAGLAFLAFAIWLSYWLLFEYKVRNVFGLGLMIVFLAIPGLLSALTLPFEFVAVKMIWQSDDPVALEKALGDLRERGGL